MLTTESRYINANLLAAVPVAPQTRKYIDWQWPLSCVLFTLSTPSTYELRRPLHPLPSKTSERMLPQLSMLPLSSSLWYCLLVLSVCHCSSLVWLLSCLLNIYACTICTFCLSQLRMPLEMYSTDFLPDSVACCAQLYYIYCLSAFPAHCHCTTFCYPLLFFFIFCQLMV